MAERIHVVGLGVETGGRLGSVAEAALRGTSAIIGTERHLKWLCSMTRTTRDSWPPMITLSKIAQLDTLLAGHDGEVAVLASGDPLFFGIGRRLSRQYPLSRLTFHGALSSIQTACSRLGLSLQDCTVVSLHGRPVHTLNRHMRPGRTLLILTDQDSTPERLAGICIAAQLEQSTLWVCERLGYDDEKIHRIDVNGFDMEAARSFAGLNVSVLQLRGRGGIIPAFPGIRDTDFVTDGEPGAGMISKRETRLQILSLLQTGSHDLVWDVGAGCGGVATELALWHPDATVIAVERHAARLRCIRANRERFGVFNVEVVDGDAPAALESAPDPDRVFIGGSAGRLPLLLDYCWQRLVPGGLLVASAVTGTSRECLRGFCVRQDIARAESVDIAVSRGRLRTGEWKNERKRPVSLFRIFKSGGVH